MASTYINMNQKLVYQNASCNHPIYVLNQSSTLSTDIVYVCVNDDLSMLASAKAVDKAPLTNEESNQYAFRGCNTYWQISLKGNCNMMTSLTLTFAYTLTYWPLNVSLHAGEATFRPMASAENEKRLALVCGKNTTGTLGLHIKYLHTCIITGLDASNLVGKTS